MQITEKKGIKIWENKAYSFEEAREFDIRFWQEAGVHARFSAAWQMITDFFKLRGQDAHQLRLRRSVQNIERLPD